MAGTELLPSVHRLDEHDPMSANSRGAHASPAPSARIRFIEPRSLTAGALPCADRARHMERSGRLANMINAMQAHDK